jgi:mono/diheme cytochrome c family protein
MTRLVVSMRAAACLLGIAVAAGLMNDAALAQAVTAQDPTDAGKAVFKRANCMGCHKWHGNGGGGYGGDALSLRRTELSREQITETVSCGRPGTGMPYFMREAYDAVACYGNHRADMTGHMPPEANIFLRPGDIEAVADYVIAHIKGKGEPSYADCASFFSEGSKVCNIYKAEKAEPVTASENSGETIGILTGKAQ